MALLNQGQPYHGSTNIAGGKLKGSTNFSPLSDYFYFLCPNCDGKEIMRILDYEVRSHQAENVYNQFYARKALNGFVLAFHLFCEKCQCEDFVKITNTVWQQGNIEDT